MGALVSKVPVDRYILSMRYLWIGALVSIALFGAACSGSGPTATPTTVHHRHHHHKTTTTTTTTTTTKAAGVTKTTLASGPNDRSACATFSTLNHGKTRNHRVIAHEFRTMFRQMKHAENADLRKDGHAAARALLQEKVSAFKVDFLSIYTLCNRML